MEMAEHLITVRPQAMSKKEFDFVENIYSQMVNDGRILSESQAEWLESIYQQKA